MRIIAVAIVTHPLADKPILCVQRDKYTPYMLKQLKALRYRCKHRSSNRGVLSRFKEDDKSNDKLCSAVREGGDGAGEASAYDDVADDVDDDAQRYVSCNGDVRHHAACRDTYPWRGLLSSADEQICCVLKASLLLKMYPR